jgi:hypothetical protein
MPPVVLFDAVTTTRGRLRFVMLEARQMHQFCVMLVVLAVLSVFVDAPQAAEPRTHGSPAAAFDSLRIAVKERDAAVFVAATTHESQDALIFSQWLEEALGERHPAALMHLVDETLRRKLTRETLPIDAREFPALLGRSLKNREKALAVVLERRSLADHLPERVGEVKILGDRATSDGKSHSGDDTGVVNFIKEGADWKVALPAPPTPVERGSPAKPSVEWSRDKSQRHASPAEALRAYERGITGNDPQLVWDALTEQARNVRIDNWMERIEAQEGSFALAWYVDVLKLQSLRKEVYDTPENRWRSLGAAVVDWVSDMSTSLARLARGPRVDAASPARDYLAAAVEARGERIQRVLEREIERVADEVENLRHADQRQQRQLLQAKRESAWDGKVLFSALVKFMHGEVTQYEYGSPELHELEVTGARARGTVICKVEQEEVAFDFYFRKVENGWRIDRAARLTEP